MRCNSKKNHRNSTGGVIMLEHTELGRNPAKVQ